MSTQEIQPKQGSRCRKGSPETKRLEGIAGPVPHHARRVRLVPHDLVPKGLWSIGVGVIMLGLNVAANLASRQDERFHHCPGVIALISGGLELLGRNNLGGAILLIVLGAYCWSSRGSISSGSLARPRKLDKE